MSAHQRRQRSGSVALLTVTLSGLLGCAVMADHKGWRPLAVWTDITPKMVQVKPTQTVSSDVDGALVPSPVRRTVEHVLVLADHANRPFLIVDKIDARLYVFSADGTLRATSPVLLGEARGDDSVPGIGNRKISEIQPFERTTPAGRFVAEAGRNLTGEDIVWVDYDIAVSMHRVRTTNPRERRLQRLASPSVEDNRISYGCINVPVAFFDTWVSPVFQSGTANIYVLPEVKTEQQAFNWPLAELAGVPSKSLSP